MFRAGRAITASWSKYPDTVRRRRVCRHYAGAGYLRVRGSGPSHIAGPRTPLQG
jgi:hypothetical protein